MKKHVNILLDEHLHKRIRHINIETNNNLSALISRLLENYIFQYESSRHSSYDSTSIIGYHPTRGVLAVLEITEDATIVYTKEYAIASRANVLRIEDFTGSPSIYHSIDSEPDSPEKYEFTIGKMIESKHFPDTGIIFYKDRQNAINSYFSRLGMR